MTGLSATWPSRWLMHLFRSRLWMQIIQTSGARIYGLTISLVTLSITAHYLGPEGRGIVAAASSWVGLAAGIGNFSMGQVVIHLAAGKDRNEWLPRTLGTLLIIIGLH